MTNNLYGGLSSSGIKTGRVYQTSLEADEFKISDELNRRALTVSKELLLLLKRKQQTLLPYLVQVIAKMQQQQHGFFQRRAKLVR